MKMETLSPEAIELLRANGLYDDQFELHELDMSEQFSILDVYRKAEEHQYRSLEAAASDLSRVLRGVTDANHIAIMKEFDCVNKRYHIGYLSHITLKQQLSTKKLGITTARKELSLWDAFNKYQSRLSVEGVSFNSSNPRIFNIFTGFKYSAAETVDMTLIQFFLDFVRDIIANGREDVYEYLMNWIAYIVKNPGKKTETCIVLKGSQGVGKNRYTDTLSELLSGYSLPNITNIDELVGQFNAAIEGQMLIVCNELKNVGASRLTNFDALKSIISDYRLRVNQKYVPSHEADNPANLIMCSNNAYPVKIESGDRRYLVLEVSAAKKGEFDYWTEFEAKKTPAFYSNLLAYLQGINLTGFNPRKMPETDAKSDLVQASGGKFGRWIDLHYTELTTDGIRLTEIMGMRPKSGEFVIEEPTFKLNVKNMLRKTTKPVTIDGVEKRQWVYVLKNEYREGHRQISIDGTDYDDLVSEKV